MLHCTCRPPCVVHSEGQGHRSAFHPSAIANNAAAVSVRRPQEPTCSAFGSILRSESAKPGGSSMFLIV